MQINVDKIYTHLEMLATHMVLPYLLPPPTLREILENIESCGVTTLISLAK